MSVSHSRRDELDGLRAISVIAVMFYHAQLSLFDIVLLPGGFLGVDIFFVLSGYLITGIILSEQNRQNFAYSHFFARRAKRILPALFVVLAASCLPAYLVLLPSDLERFSHSLISTLLFVSNFFFYSEESYIAEASIFKPLLHTWSLSLEWQFYLLFPLFMALLQRHLPNKKPLVFFVIIYFSLLTSLVTSQTDRDFAFYLLPSRIWELFAGGVLCFWHRTGTRSRWSAWMPILGLAMVLCSFVYIEDTTTYLSLLTLVPVIGTCLIIIYASPNRWVTRILSNRVFVYIGLISYSLYLWHQPVFVFYRFVYSEIVDFADFALLSAISAILAVLTYHAVEIKYRRSSLGRLRISCLAALFLSSLLFALVALNKHGFPERLGADVLKMYEMYAQPEFRRFADENSDDVSHSPCSKRLPESACRTGDESWVTLGDSHAAVFDFALSELLKEKGKGLISLVYEQCPFTGDQYWYGNMELCPQVNKQRWLKINAFKSKKTFLVSANYALFRWAKNAKAVRKVSTSEDRGSYLSNKENNVIRAFAGEVNRLLDMGHRVVVVYPVPDPGLEVKAAVFSQIRSAAAKLEITHSPDARGFQQAQQLAEKLDRVLPDRLGLQKIKPTEVLCDDAGDCLVIDEAGGYYNLGSHLSYLGVKRLLNEVDGL